MSSSVEVLCPNGHRQKVKTSPNTTLLQVLEECCAKHGFKPVSDFELKHGKKNLDLTLSVRFTGLPNHAKLEMVQAKKSRTESDVILALQLMAGERLQHKFSPATSLWDILCFWEQQPNSIHAGKLTRSDIPGHHPTVVYMRDEILGEYAMRETSLRQLGLTGGKAVIRLNHKAVDEEILSNIKAKIDQDKSRKMRLLAKATGLGHHGKQAADASSQSTTRSDPQLAAMDTGQQNSCTSMDTESAGSVSKCASLGRSEEPMDEDVTVANVGASKASSGSNITARIESKAAEPSSSKNSSVSHVANIPGVQVLQPGEISLTPVEQQQAMEYARTIMPGLFPQLMPDPVQSHTPVQQPLPYVPAPTPLPEFKFPEASKGKNLYRNELNDSSKEDFKPCERETVVYSQEDCLQVEQTSTEAEDLPEGFFDVTESDVRSMMTELQKKVALEKEQPLMTSVMRLAARETRAAKYQRVVIRFHFPDKLVLQAIFRPRETVHSLNKFIKEHLEDKSIKFYLYTTPPKSILKDTSQTLIEADLVPMTLVYFGSESQQENYLSTAVLKEKCSQNEADCIVLKHMSSSVSSQTGSSGSGQASSSSNRRRATASTDQTKESGSQKLPKWFKVGKK